MTGAAGARGEGGRGGGTARSSAARLLAVQALYQVSLSGSPGDAVLEEFLRYRLGEAALDDEGTPGARPRRALFTELFRGTLRRQGEIDDMIASALPAAWPFERLEIVLREILRCGVYELLERAGTPARAVISEYVGMAQAFYAGAEPGMVNAILDRLARVVRAAEFEPRDEAAEAG